MAYVAEDKNVILPDGRFDAIVMATCRDAQEAEFVAACYRAFGNVSHPTRMFLLDGGIIDRAAKAFEKEAELVADRLMLDAAADAAASRRPALAAE